MEKGSGIKKIRKGELIQIGDTPEDIFSQLPPLQSGSR